jgi:spermidine/putrescine-binding protein
MRARHDPQQADDNLFRSYFENNLAPTFEKQYGIAINYGKYDDIIAQAKKVLS